MFRRRRKAAGGVTFYGPEDTIDSKFNISGESYRRDEITALVRSGRRLVHRDEGWERLGAQFWLVPDPENPYDKTAVAVFAGSRDGFDADTAVLVGYVSAAKAKWMSPLLTEPYAVAGIIVGRDGRYGVKLHGYPLTKARLTKELKDRTG